MVGWVQGLAATPSLVMMTGATRRLFSDQSTPPIFCYNERQTDAYVALAHRCTHWWPVLPSDLLPLTCPAPAHAKQAGADAARVPCHAGLSDELRAVPHQHHAGHVCWLHSNRDGEWLAGNEEDSEGAGDGWPPWLLTRGEGLRTTKCGGLPGHVGLLARRLCSWVACTATAIASARRQGGKGEHKIARSCSCFMAGNLVI